MKKLAAIPLLILIILSCNKDHVSWSFTWTHQNVSHSATSADAYISPAGLGLGPNQIVANDGSSTSFKVSIQLTSLNARSYVVSLASNKFYYIDDSGNDLAGAQGTVTIASNSSNTLSGNFSVKLINVSSDTTTIAGSFTDINLHP